MQNIDDKTDRISDKLIAYLRDELKNADIDYFSSLKRLQGGYETLSYRFKIIGVRDELSDYLVLRLYPSFYGAHNALWESAVQNVLAGQGYPVAKAHLVCTDMSILGGAFYIMDYIPGQPLGFAQPETVPGLLGKTHAELHNIDPAPLIRTLNEQGIDAYGYSLDSRYDWLNKNAEELVWVREAVRWLIDQRPSDPLRLAVCHGDFHAFNILVKDGVVTGVLDWPGFTIADPVYDVANTIVLTTIPARHLTASMDGFSSIDWDTAAALYLAAYRSHNPLDSTHLEYYKARRCVMALIQGFEGQKVWQHPMIVDDLVGTISDITGIQVIVPA
jgi:aminoglycoside phosphotransferase (APT) family kinase protein